MKTLIAILVTFSFSVSAETRELSSGKMEYQVSHLIKTISATSNEIKGKMECGESECEFLLGAKVQSFTSSDSNRDANMLTVTEASKFPLVTGSGKISVSQLNGSGEVQHQVSIDFHGVKKNYAVRTIITAGKKLVSKFVLNLDSHGVERPSLFGVKIKNDVPMTLEAEWNSK